MRFFVALASTEIEDPMPKNTALLLLALLCVALLAATILLSFLPSRGGSYRDLYPDEWRRVFHGRGEPYHSQIAQRLTPLAVVGADRVFLGNTEENTLTNADWIALLLVAVTLIVVVGGWIFLDPKRAGPTQSQTVRGGTGIQSGRDTKIGR